MLERSGIGIEYARVPAGVEVHVAQGRQRVSAVLEWAFGAGAQAYTPVGRIGQTWFEHRVSYYAATGHLWRTLGHPADPSPNPRAALGMLQDSQTIYRCFNCHATAVRPGPDLTSMIPGITCERCHGAAAAHVVNPARSKPRARFDRASVLALCGECHRLPPERPSPVPESQDPVSIRFAPVGLVASACYLRGTSLSCLTCHDPHENARRDAAFYTGVCTGCHAHPPQACKLEPRANCITCHMRRRSIAPYLAFTDHRIRVYRGTGSGGMPAKLN